MNVTKLVIECLLLLAFGGCTMFMSVFHVADPWLIARVTCNDGRYRQPIVAVSDQLVPLKWLYIAMLVVLPSLFFAVSMILTGRFPKGNREMTSEMQQKTFGTCCNAVALYYCGIFFLILMCKASQMIGGSPAPNFLTLCSPGCSNSSGSSINPRTRLVYITQKICAAEKLRPDTLSSFPSVHAALSFYAASFLSAFFLSVGTTSYTRLLQPSMAILSLVLAFVASLSRINEFSNHVIDVTCGAGMGIGLACVQVFISGAKVADAHKAKGD